VVANLQSRGRGHRDTGMVQSERALVSSYRPSIQIIPLSDSFARNFRLEFFWRGLRTPNLGEEETVGGRR